jgi:hypothetical protein
MMGSCLSVFDQVPSRHEILPLSPPIPENAARRHQSKKAAKKDIGITAVLKPFRWWPNQKRRIKREVGYYSETGRLI